MHLSGLPHLPWGPPPPCKLTREETTVNRHGLITSSSWSKRRGRLAQQRYARATRMLARRACMSLGLEF